MKMKKIFLTAIPIIVFSLALTACAGFLPMDEEAPSGEFGPAYSPQEQQTQTFEALWSHIQDDYVRPIPSGSTPA